MHTCARGGRIYSIPVSMLISSKGDLSEKRNTNSISCLLHLLPCRKYMIKHFPRFILFNSQSMSICCSPSAGPYMPISVPDYPSEILRLSDLLSLPPILIQDPAFYACPASHSYLPPPPSSLHMLQSPCAAALPPQLQSHTHTKPLLPIKHFHSAKPHN